MYTDWRHYKVIVSILIILLVIGTGFAQLFDSKIGNNTNICASYLSKESSSLHNYVALQASSHFEYGMKCGTLFYGFFHIVSSFIQLLTRENDTIQDELDIQKKMYERYSPHFLEELKGLSVATNIKLDTLLRAQLLLKKSCRQQCTITIATGNATSDNQTFLTQNWDLDTKNIYFYLFRHIFSKILFINDIEPYYAYVFIGIPILYEHPLLNEKGLGWSGTGTHLTENRSRSHDEGDGIPPYVLVRESMMNCETVAEVALLWSNSTRSSHPSRFFHNDWDYDTYGWCDTQGGILLIEQTHSYIATLFHNPKNNDKTDILCHTNHHYVLNPLKTGSIVPGENEKSNSSQLRLSRAYELLMMNYGNISLNVCKNLTRDHEKGTGLEEPDSSDICSHADSNDSYATSIAWIIHPQHLILYLTNDYPCKSIFKQYNCSNMFKQYRK